ncbi:MAG: flagellar biosynthetic protein FliQ [Myxococcota bacterium]
MSRDQALAWYTEMLWAAVTAAAPVVLTVVVVGLVIAIVQAATQVNDQAVAFGPKALAAIVALTMAGSFIIAEVGDFTTRCLEGLASVGAAAEQ